MKFYNLVFWTSFNESHRNISKEVQNIYLPLFRKTLYIYFQEGNMFKELNICGSVHRAFVVVGTTQNNKTVTTYNSTQPTQIGTNLLSKCARLPVAIYSTYTPDNW